MEDWKNFRRLSDVQKLNIYMAGVKPILNKRALFTDGTKYYRTYHKTEDGYEACLKFRTAKDNVDSVYVVTSGGRYEMEKSVSDHLFDFYQAKVPCDENCYEYYFQINNGKVIVFYNKRGCMDEVQDYYNFKLVPEFKTPDWAKGAIFYQIFTDRFCNGDVSNDVLEREYLYIKEASGKAADWYEHPKTMDVHRFYGGDLQGVMDKLDYLKDLGVDVIYLNPIFVSPSNHKYDIEDYDYVDPHFGVIIKDEGECLPEWEDANSRATRYICRVTSRENLEASNELFIRLVEAIHSRGMKVILDGVFNHCGSFNKWLDRERIYENQEGYEKGAFIDENSPYRSFFKFREGSAWPYNAQYDGWWGHDTLPKLNYEESSLLEEYILKIAQKWVSPPFNADGWRLDVAADLGKSLEYNHQFWQKFRKAVKEANPSALILAEHYGDPSNWLKGDQWDTVMNYDAFMEPVTWFLTGLEKHSDEFRGDLMGNDESFQNAMSHHMSRFHNESLFVAMNELSNHDHSRFMTRTNKKVGRIGSMGAEAAGQGIDKAIMRQGVVMQMTWPGAPTIYYGDEVGLCGWTDPDSRRTFPWGREDMELLQFHKDMIRIHKENSALVMGSLKFLFGRQGMIAYGRFDDRQQCVVIINCNTEDGVKVDIPVWEIGVADGSRMTCLIRSRRDDYTLANEAYIVSDGVLSIELNGESAIVLKNS